MENSLDDEKCLYIIETRKIQVSGVSQNERCFTDRVINAYRITCTDESFTVRPETCVKKVNRVSFDFMLTSVS